jgi:hypothetical protein
MGLLDSWTAGRHTAGEITHPTYRKGSGPAVIVIHEIPGITPAVIAFAEEPEPHPMVTHGHRTLRVRRSSAPRPDDRPARVVVPQRGGVPRELTPVARDENDEVEVPDKHGRLVKRRKRVPLAAVARPDAECRGLGELSAAVIGLKEKLKVLVPEVLARDIGRLEGDARAVR